MSVRPRPNILWRLFAVGGVATMTGLSLNDQVWEQWRDNIGDVVPRSAIRKLLAGTVGLHVVEAAFVHRSAREAGVDRPGRWARTALLYGFPVMLRLRRAVAAGEGTVQ